MEKLFDMSLMPVSGKLDEKMLHQQNNLLIKLDEMAASVWPDEVEVIQIPCESDNESKPFSLKIYVVPNQNPINFFSYHCKNGFSESEKIRHQSKYKNTLIGFLTH